MTPGKNTFGSVDTGASGLRLGCAVIAVLAALYFGRDVLIPLAFAVTLTLVLAPAVGWLQKLRIRRFAAVLLVMVLSIGVACGIGYVILNQIVQAVSDLPSYRENIHKKISALRTPDKGALGRVARTVQELGKELGAPQEAPTQPAPALPPWAGRLNTPANPLPVQVVEAPANSLDYVRDLAQPFLGPIATLGIVLVFTLFLLAGESDLRNRLFHLAGLNQLNVMTQALDDATSRVSRYLMLQFLVNAGLGVVCGLGLYWIGVPYAALWGTVAALLRLIPYAGSVVAAALPLLLSLAVFDGWRQPSMVIALFATVEVVTGNLLEPRLYGVHTGISSLALLLTTVFWTTLWGPAGLILSTPLTVCVVVLGRHVPQLSFLYVLLGDQPVLAPKAHLYQRLLAMDDQDARTVAEDYLSDRSLLQLYDEVILPLLTMAEQDRHKGALDPEREEFLFLNVREMLAEFSEKVQKSDPEGSTELPEPEAPARILCLPARDEADEIAAAMLAQLLEGAGFPAVSFPADSPLQGVLDVLEPNANDIFCISAIPPFAFSHARTMNRRLRERFPATKVLIGVWGFSGQIDRALQRFQPAPPDKLVTSLSDALRYLGTPVSAPNVDVEVPTLAGLAPELQ